MEQFPEYVEPAAELPGVPAAPPPGPPRWEVRLQEQSGNVYAPRFAGAFTPSPTPRYDPYQGPVYATHPLTSHPPDTSNNTAPNDSNNTDQNVASPSNIAPHTSSNATSSASPAAKAVRQGVLKYKRSTSNLMKYMRRPTNERPTNESKESINISSPYNARHVAHVSPNTSMSGLVNATNPGISDNHPWVGRPEDLDPQTQPTTAQRDSRQYADGTPFRQRLREFCSKRRARRVSIEEEYEDEETRMRVNRERSLMSLTYNERNITPSEADETAAGAAEASPAPSTPADKSAGKANIAHPIATGTFADAATATPGYPSSKSKERAIDRPSEEEKDAATDVAAALPTPKDAAAALSIPASEGEGKVKATNKRDSFMATRYEMGSRKKAQPFKTAYVGMAGPHDRVKCFAQFPKQWRARHDRMICAMDVLKKGSGSYVYEFLKVFPEIDGFGVTEEMIDLRLRKLDSNVGCTYFRNALGRQ